MNLKAEPKEKADSTRHEERHRDWPVGVLAIVLLLLFSPLGSRLPEVVQTVAFLMLVVLPFFLTPLAWWRFARVRRDETVSRWRLWVSVCGCVGLSLAFAMFCSLHWTSMWIVGFSMASVLAGTLAERTVRFPLFFGGLTVGGLVMMFPIGVL